MTLDVHNLCVHAQGSDTLILDHFSISTKPGQIHAIMGPNGAGKSSFTRVLAGSEDYTVIQGSVSCNGQSILELDPEERSLLGLFVGFQYPTIIPGLSNRRFLWTLHQAHKKPGTKEDFDKLLEEKAQLLGIPLSFLDRGLNDGLSGGEKKRNEILQMAVLDPTWIVLDETDSGLDIDALRQVAASIRQLHNPTKTLILITHYQRLLDYIEPDFVHIMEQGKLTRTGNAELARTIDKVGYEVAS